MCVRRSWVLGGGRYQNTYTVKGLLQKVPDANSCGTGTKRDQVCCGAFFYNGRHVTPKGLLLIGETGSPVPYQNFYSRVRMDVTHFGNQLYLMLVDCDPSHFALWKPLQHQDLTSIIKQLEAVFCERGPLSELFTDNGTAFCGERLAQFAKVWGVHRYFQYAHVPLRNEIIERSHHTIKNVVTRICCSIQEAVYWHNFMPIDDETASTAPANLTYTNKIHLKGINVTLPQDNTISSPYIVRDAVWIKCQNGRCTTQFDRVTVTGIYSPHSCESCPPYAWGE